LDKWNKMMECTLKKEKSGSSRWKARGTEWWRIIGSGSPERWELFVHDWTYSEDTFRRRAFCW
jgi:hypothetical protein